jgi:1-phosphofructokinase family hexose kinase
VITVAGLTPSLDLTYLVDDLRLGAIHRPQGLVACAGGKALNMGRVAARLGADVRVTAVLGGAAGDHVATLLAADGVPHDIIDSPVETRTCVSIAAARSRELTELYQYAPAMPAQVWRAFLSATSTDLSSRPGWLSISGAPPADLPTDALGDLVRLAHRHGTRVAVDTHGPGLEAAVAPRPELVKINRAEAAELLGSESGADLPTMARRIRAQTGGIVVLTDGQAGAIAVVGEQTHRVPAPTRVGRFPVGSGDAFLGGLVAMLDRGASLSDALRTAAAAGTANALQPGPGVVDPGVVAALAAETTISSR